jgi:N-acetylmuramoyl-L-alanine amidase
MTRLCATSADSITSLAEDHGFFWETIWNHGENAPLKSQRQDPNIIRAGDEVFIPEKTTRLENRATEARHRFKKKGVPAMLKLRLTRLGEPRADEPYALVIDGKITTGSTDASGMLEHPIPPNARSALLRLRDGAEEYPIAIGGLDPWDTPTGFVQRLANMGFDPAPADAPLSDPKTSRAIRVFQNRVGLPVTGKADEATMRKADESHV